MKDTLSTENKDRLALRMKPDTKRKIEQWYKAAGCRSKNQFVEQAVNFYVDHLAVQQGSLIPPLLLSPPQPLRWVAAGTPVCAALRPVSAWLLLITAWHIFPLSGPTRPALPQRATQGPTPRFTGWEVHGCHPVYRRATNGLTVRNKGADLREPQRRLSNWVMWLALERRFPEQAG